jgi:site-specific recombinase XerC
MSAELRLSELTGLMLDDVDFDLEVVVVVGKGRRERATPFNARTAQSTRFSPVVAVKPTPSAYSVGNLVRVHA